MIESPSVDPSTEAIAALGLDPDIRALLRAVVGGIVRDFANALSPDDLPGAVTIQIGLFSMIAEACARQSLDAAALAHKLAKPVAPAG